MRLSTRTRYGTRLLLDISLHQKDGPVCIKDVSKRQGISIKYLEKIVRVLHKHGYVKSKRGPRGGYTLALSPDKITVGEIFRLLEGSRALTECVDTGTVCTREGYCLTRRVWIKASKAMFEILNSITFADLMREAQGEPEIFETLPGT